MGIPKNFGISKIGMLRGEEESRYGGREASSSSRRDAQLEQLSFELDSTRDAVALLQPPSFNVLYVSTPKIGLLQTPEFRAVSQLWSETVELVKPLLRFGFPDTSLKTKCPYYDDKLYATSSGILLANDRTRTLMDGFHKGYLGPTHNSSEAAAAHKQEQQLEREGSSNGSSIQQQQPGQSVGMFGLSTLAFLARHVMPGHKNNNQQQQQQQQVVVMTQQQQEQQQQLVQGAAAVQPAAAPLDSYHQQQGSHGHGHGHGSIPRGHFLVPDIPSGTLVLGLNLMAYWAITNQSRRSSMGGTMTG